MMAVNQDGKFEYICTEQATSEKPFDPRGIATDSQSRVLITAKMYCHILNQEVQLLSLMSMNVYCSNGVCID